jgi:solute carrier family 25 carnitine/acylcarnitine transporter 20/29
MQTDTLSPTSKSMALNPKQQKSTFGTIQDILQREGLSGLYHGVSAPMVAVAPIWAVSFWGFDTGDKLVRAAFGLGAPSRLNILQLCLAGGFSALPTALVMVPCERIKCLLQTQNQPSGRNSPLLQRGGGGSAVAAQEYYTGFSDCAFKLYQEKGLGGLYKGTALTLMRDIPGNMVYFGVYEVAKRYMGPGVAGALVAGALAGLSLWPVILPMDCLKSRYQAAPEGTYKNIGHVYQQLIQEDGAAGMFRGIGPAMIRAAPANSISFLGAEVTKTALSKLIR